MKHTSQQLITEQREYFRVDDVSILNYRVVAEEALAARAAVVDSGYTDKLTFKAKFDSLTRGLQPIRNRIKTTHPEVEQYLSVLDSKLNMLAEQLVGEELKAMGSVPQKVNVGAGGLSFSSPLPLKTGALLELKVILLPELTGIFSYARVVSCTKNTEERTESEAYRIAVTFEQMDEEVKDIISRHVLGKEQASLRKSKESAS